MQNTLELLPDSNPVAFERLLELTDQGQFEMIYPDDLKQGKIRLIYMMNDAAESFLVFEQARMKGKYKKDFEGEIEAELHLMKDQQEYGLIIRQAENVFTLFFRNLTVETRLYNYGEIGHFWISGYEYLRQIEYKASIIRDKREYLGNDFCNETERKLAELADFPPLNYCCYPSVSEQYIFYRDDPWSPSEEAMDVMEELLEKVDDRRMLRILRLYRRHPYKVLARYMARMFHRSSHDKIVDLLQEMIVEAAKTYPKRRLQTDEKVRYEKLRKKAEMRKNELESQGIRATIFCEEPFEAVRDSVDLKVYLIIWKRRTFNRKVRIEEII